MSRTTPFRAGGIPPAEPMLKADEAAARLAVSTRTVTNMAANGTIPAKRVGNLWRFDARKLEQWINDARWEAGGKEAA